MNQTTRILTSISSVEPDSFNEFLRALGDEAPERGAKQDWYILFKTLESLEESGLVEIERSGKSIDTLILTPLGAERVRESLRER